MCEPFLICSNDSFHLVELTLPQSCLEDFLNVPNIPARERCLMPSGPAPQSYSNRDQEGSQRETE
jgi:hypothetical protein